MNMGKWGVTLRASLPHFQLYLHHSMLTDKTSFFYSFLRSMIVSGT